MDHLQGQVPGSTPRAPERQVSSILVEPMIEGPIEPARDIRELYDSRLWGSCVVVYVDTTGGSRGG